MLTSCTPLKCQYTIKGPWTSKARCRSIKGVGLFEFQTPPLPDPPKVFDPVYLQFEIVGERAGAKGAEFFFFCTSEGVFFFTLCVYTQNTQNFVENSKMFEKHRKVFDP